MRHTLVVLLLAVCALAQNSGEPKQASVPTTFFKHTLGETFPQWQSLVLADCASDPRGKTHLGDFKKECKQVPTLQAPSSDNEKQWITKWDGKAWVFRKGMLVSMVFDFQPYEPTIALLTERYGMPIQATKDSLENGYGARWAVHNIAWAMPDGTIIFLQAEPESFGTTYAKVVFCTQAEIDLEGQEAAAAKRPNPY